MKDKLDFIIALLGFLIGMGIAHVINTLLADVLK